MASTTNVHIYVTPTQGPAQHTQHPLDPSSSHADAEILPPVVVGTTVRPGRPVKPHEQVSEVVLEELVVDVVVRGRPQAALAEGRLPREAGLRVDEREPVGAHGPKGHVRPDVAVPDDVGRDEGGRRIMRAVSGTLPSKASKSLGLVSLWCGLCERQ